MVGACGSTAARDLLLEWIREPAVRQSWYPELLEAICEHWCEHVRKAICEVTEQSLWDGLGQRDRHNDEFHLTKAFSEMARKDEVFAKHLYCRAASLATNRDRELLSSILHELGGDEAVLASCLLLDDSSSNPIPYGVRKALESAFTIHKPTGHESSYYIIPRAFNVAREQLLDMALTDTRRAKSAKLLLLLIENNRFEIGKTADEPRHPNLEAMHMFDTPWPLL